MVDQDEGSTSGADTDEKPELTKREVRRWIDSHAFRIEFVGRDMILIPLPELTDYVDVEIGKLQ